MSQLTLSLNDAEAAAYVVDTVVAECGTTSGSGLYRMQHRGY
jgi:hypothetical protein